MPGNETISSPYTVVFIIICIIVTDNQPYFVEHGVVVCTASTQKRSDIVTTTVIITLPPQEKPKQKQQSKEPAEPDNDTNSEDSDSKVLHFSSGTNRKCQYQKKFRACLCRPQEKRVEQRTAEHTNNNTIN
jgi:hypothetical protein